MQSLQETTPKPPKVARGNRAIGAPDAVLDAFMSRTEAAKLVRAGHELRLPDSLQRGLSVLLRDADAAFTEAVPSTRNGVAVKLFSVRAVLEACADDVRRDHSADDLEPRIQAASDNLVSAIKAIRQGALGPCEEGKDECPAVAASERRDAAAKRVECWARRYGPQASSEPAALRRADEWSDAHDEYLKAVPSSGVGMVHKLDLAVLILDDLADESAIKIAGGLSVALLLVGSVVDGVRLPRA